MYMPKIIAGLLLLLPAARKTQWQTNWSKRILDYRQEQNSVTGYKLEILHPPFQHATN